jgi:hypothetical protein
MRLRHGCLIEFTASEAVTMSDLFGPKLSRRRVAFWLGFGLFGLSRKLNAGGLDRLAAAMMRATESTPATPNPPEHWAVGENRTWRWFEREILVGDRWVSKGITTPIHKRTGERYTGHTGYLDDSLVPESLRLGTPVIQEDPEQAAILKQAALEDAKDDPAPGKSSEIRRARHGRPPSRWLRSLNTDELHIWLAKIEVPEAGVSGMTFFEHLTRDHFFDGTRIAGLVEDDLAKLHAAAHAGY